MVNMVESLQKKPLLCAINKGNEEFLGRSLCIPCFIPSHSRVDEEDEEPIKQTLLILTYFPPPPRCYNHPRRVGRRRRCGAIK